MPTTRDDRMLTIDQVAERLGVSRRHVYRLLDAGELRAVDISVGSRGRQRIAALEVDAFLARRAQ